MATNEITVGRRPARRHEAQSSMTDVLTTVARLAFRGRFEDAAAPRTCAGSRRLLRYRARVIQARGSVRRGGPGRRDPLRGGPWHDAPGPERRERLIRAGPRRAILSGPTDGAVAAEGCQCRPRSQPRLPTFDTAVDLHRFLDTIRQFSDAGRELPVA